MEISQRHAAFFGKSQNLTFRLRNVNLISIYKIKLFLLEMLLLNRFKLAITGIHILVSNHFLSFIDIFIYFISSIFYLICARILNKPLYKSSGHALF